MVKVKFLQVQNLLVSLKAVATSILTALIMVIPMGLAVFLIREGFMFPGRILQLISLVGYLFVWGWISRRIWRWA